MHQTIHNWIRNLILCGDLPINLVDENFLIEDGMTLTEYWEYEKNSFDSYSKIFDLNENFDVKIIKTTRVNNKNSCLIYVLNSLNKIAFKMNITLTDDGLISSNELNAQIVPKYVIENGAIKNFGMAIKSRFVLENIISPELEKISFQKGSNYEEDSFYNAQFKKNENDENRDYLFLLKFKNLNKTEKRWVHFDQFKAEDCPYTIKDGLLSTKDSNYPVNLAIYYNNGTIDNFVYPRNIIKKLDCISKVIITDVLDNDWIVRF